MKLLTILFGAMVPDPSASICCVLSVRLRRDLRGCASRKSIVCMIIPERLLHITAGRVTVSYP
jgi:hypothetical protein